MQLPLIIPLTLFIIFPSCHLFDNDDELANIAVYFNESNVSVFEGGLASLSLRIEPPDGLSHYTVEYGILNEEIAVIFRSDRRGVVFAGMKAGSTVITAKIGNAEAKAVINVFEHMN
ncbi:MAG: Ig-like domain-containing protein [Treponema sp.]|nr:Ig-like domain-containing protein [Treponema sp.]